jgi:hypothetical protein
MTPAELAAEAARVMGKMFDTNGQRVWLLDGTDQPPIFDLAVRLDDVARFGAAFLAAWPDILFQVNKNPGQTWSVYFFTESGPAWRATAASEATARTIATLKAWTGLKQGEG